MHTQTPAHTYALCRHLLPFLKRTEPDRAPRGEAVGRGGEQAADASALCFFGVFRENERALVWERESESGRESRNAKPSHRHKPDTPSPTPLLPIWQAGQ